MAKHDDKDEPEWIKKVKSEGPIPLLESENCPNGWASPPGINFMVRGPQYFTNKVKVPAGDYFLKPLGFDWIKSSSKVANLLKDPNYRVTKVLDNEFKGQDQPFVWAFNLQIPSKENYSAIAYFASTEPFPEGSMIDQFLKGDDAAKNSRLKLIANIVKGPWIVKKAVGEQAICLIGGALTCNYCVGENCLEVDIDIGSSVVSNAIVHLAFGYITTLTVDLAFLIESQTEAELPEQILGGFRFSELQPDSARSYETSDAELNPPAELIPPSTPRLGMRLWTKVRQGFSQLLRPGADSGSPRSEPAPDSGSPHPEPALHSGSPISAPAPNSGSPHSEPAPVSGLTHSEPAPDSGSQLPEPALDSGLPNSEPTPDSGVPHSEPTSDSNSLSSERALDSGSLHSESTHDSGSPHSKPAHDSGSPQSERTLDSSSPHSETAPDSGSQQPKLAPDSSSPHSEPAPDSSSPHSEPAPDSGPSHSEPVPDSGSPQSKPAPDSSSSHLNETAEHNDTTET